MAARKRASDDRAKALADRYITPDGKKPRKPKADKPAPEPVDEPSYEPETPKKIGRPAKYKREYVKQVRQWIELGATNAEMAKYLSITERTFIRWMHAHPELCHAIKTAKLVADERVERSLYQRAVGYKQKAVKIFAPAGFRKAPVYAEYIEHVQPDVTAQIFWLKNRRPAEWREKHELEHSGSEAFMALWQRVAGWSAQS